MGLLRGSTLVVRVTPYWFGRNTRERRWGLPRKFHVGFEVCGYETALFLDIVHNVGLVRHVPLTIRDDLLEVVREELSTNVDSKRALKNGISRDEMAFLTFSPRSIRSIPK